MAKPKTKPKTKPRPAPSRPASRKSRAEELRRRRERRSVRNRMLVAVVLAALAGVVLFVTMRGGTDSGPAVESASCRQDSEYDGRSRDHISNPTYEVNPPAGGAHTPNAAQPGFYREGRPPPPDGQLVHAMEHGFVVLWYRPDLGAADMQKVEALSDRFGRELIVVPRPSLGGPVAVTAWHQRMLCTAIDADAIAEFVEGYTDKGPEKGFL
jgi:hypothetical protein